VFEMHDGQRGKAVWFKCQLTSPYLYVCISVLPTTGGLVVRAVWARVSAVASISCRPEATRGNTWRPALLTWLGHRIGQKLACQHLEIDALVSPSWEDCRVHSLSWAKTLWPENMRHLAIVLFRLRWKQLSSSSAARGCLGWTSN